jgi:molybdenum cofactor cytidylyltransferase
MTISGKDHIPGSYGIILLAAGESSRLGKPKQLLLYNGKTLLQHSIQAAMGTGIRTIVTVLGANADLFKEKIGEEAVDVVLNTEWKEGMATSIRAGLDRLLELAPGIEAALMMVCDQPFVTTALLNDLLIKYQQTGKPIIASRYETGMGTPALFDKTIFAALKDLKGDTGAKKIMKENPDWVETVNFPLGNIDIDTQTDYKKLLNP